MIAIKNMEMLHDCPMCPMSHWAYNGDFTGCNVAGGKRHIRKSDREFWESSSRPDWCPLTDLPDGLYQVQGEKIWKYHGKGEKR